MSPYESLVKDPSLPVARPTVSYWQVPPDKKLFGIKSEQLPANCEVAVIGSGVSSCSVVRHLLTSGFPGSVVVLEAREVCSGATGRNGGRLHVHAIQDFDKFCRMYGDEAAKKIIRFQLAHYDEMEAAAKALGPELYKRSAIRQTESVAAVFSDAKFEELKSLHAAFEKAFPDLVGRWKIVGSDEAQGVCWSETYLSYHYNGDTDLY
jgi:glycine/D-amino acid oxidase-like deaminating enzyme